MLLLELTIKERQQRTNSKKHNLPQCIEEKKPTTLDQDCNNEISSDKCYWNVDLNTESNQNAIKNRMSIQSKNKKELIRLWKTEKENKARILKVEEAKKKSLTLKKASFKE